MIFELIKYVIELIFLGLLIYYLNAIKNKSLIESILFIASITFLLIGYIYVIY